MARFIDADKLIWQVQDSDKYGTITKQVFISLLQNSETEDVAPIAHAHWIDTLYGWACSNCEKEQEYTLFLKYCPSCGAKMDEEVDDG